MADETPGENTERNTGLQNLRPPWPKGVSGNPGGRPKKKPITEAFERLMPLPVPPEEIAKLGLSGLPEGATWADAIARGVAISAALGKAEACREVTDRIEGRVATPLTGAEGSALIPAALAQAAAAIAGMSSDELEDFLRKDGSGRSTQ